MTRSDDERRESSLAPGWVVEPSGGDPAHPRAGGAGSADPTGRRNEDGDGGAPEPAGAPDPGQLGPGELVLLGVFGGLALLYTWGWFIVARAYSELTVTVSAGSGTLGSVLQQIVYWAAPLAPLLWFLAGFVFHRRRPIRLGVWLAAGAVLLVPLPMLIAGGQG